MTRFGKKLTLKDTTLSLAQGKNKEKLVEELNARWNLQEGAFIINQGKSMFKFCP